MSLVAVPSLLGSLVALPVTNAAELPVATPSVVGSPAVAQPSVTAPVVKAPLR
jgi:hypothetical protein